MDAQQHAPDSDWWDEVAQLRAENIALRETLQQYIVDHRCRMYRHCPTQDRAEALLGKEIQ